MTVAARDATITVTSVRRTGFLTLPLLFLLTSCATAGIGGARTPGPFDPGGGRIPVSETVRELCGRRVNTMLVRLSDRYVELAAQWERLGVYAEAVKTDGVTAEETQGALERVENLEDAIGDYRRTARMLRTAGARVDGANAAGCDRDVIAVFESINAEKEKEIAFVETESRKVLGALGG